MFYFSRFKIAQHEIILALPEEGHAAGLFEVISNDRETLSRWMPWAETTQSINDERQFIRYARAQITNYDLLLCTIIVDGQPVGMVDLHNINKQHHTAELGYWLSSEYQGQGVMTTAVNHLIAHAFTQMGINKIILQADSENSKSIAVAHRLGFVFEATLKSQIRYRDTYKNLNIFAKFNPQTKH